MNTSNRILHWAGFAALALISVSPLAAFPSGANHFASATVIPASGDTFSNVTDLFGFTFEPGELTHNPNNLNNDINATGSKSAWWKWTPTENGFCTVDTSATLTYLNFQNPVHDTVLSVYTGAAVNALTRITANNFHSVASVNPDHQFAKANFYAIAGTTYYIAVDGGSPGEITSTKRNLILRVQQLPAKAVTRRNLWCMNNADLTQRGIITVTTTAAGSFSAVLQTGKTTYRFTGFFDSDGTCRRAPPRTAARGAPPLTPIVVTLDGRGEGLMLIEIGGNYASDILPAQVVFPRTAPAQVAGDFNIASRDEINNNNSSRGYMRVTISPTGVVNATGVAPDGQIITFSTMLLQDEADSYYMPAFLPLHQGGGAYAYQGYSYVGATDEQDFIEADTEYIRPSKPNSVFLPNGLRVFEYTSGHLYIKPALNNRALGFLNPNGLGNFFVYEMSGEMANRVIESFTLTTANKCIFATSPRKPVLTINTATGIVTGSLSTTDTILGITKARTRTVRGLLFKDDNGDIQLKGHATGITQHLMFDAKMRSLAAE